MNLFLKKYLFNFLPKVGIEQKMSFVKNQNPAFEAQIPNILLLKI